MARAQTTKKADKAPASKKASSHPPYAELIKSSILALKDRNGSSRQSLKKYIQTNHHITAPTFDHLFNSALKRGVEKGLFIQPKGPSGPVKLNKKPAAKPEVESIVIASKPTTKKAVPAKKAPAKKDTAVKSTPAKKAAPAKKVAPAKKASSEKKAAPAKKAAAAKKSPVKAKAKAAPAKVTKPASKKAAPKRAAKK